MNRNSKEAIVLAIDCGKSMTQKSYKNVEKSVFELSKQCLENIIKQKIFAETKNHYLVLEFPTEAPEALNRRLQTPNFGQIKELNELKPTLYQSNVMDALEEAIIVIIEETRDQKFSKLKIALLTNFGQLGESDINRFKTSIAQQLSDNSIELILMCDFTPDSHSGLDLSKSQIRALDLMKVIEGDHPLGTLGYCFLLETAVQQFSKFEARRTNPSPWYSKLELGKGVNSVSIPISAFIKSETYKPKTGTEAYVQTNTTQPNDGSSLQSDVKPMEIAIDKGVTYRPRDDQSFEEVEQNELISGYYFGQTLVPFTEDDKKAFNYDKNEKGFKILGFTPNHNIDLSQHTGQKSYIVFPDPRPKQNNHKQVFQTLVTAMIDQNSVAIVRYNWSDRSAPQIGYLYPFKELEAIEGRDVSNVVLIYNVLPFDEDVRRYRFPSLETPKNGPTVEQLEAIDSLIDSMDLMSADIDEDGMSCEAIKTHQISNPVLQHWFQCLYHRTVFGNEVELPEVSDYLKKLMEPPLEISDKSFKALRKISKNFSLECLKEKSTQKRQQMNEKNSQSTSGSPKRLRISGESNDDIIEIETIKSEVNDMIESKVPFLEISDKFSDSIQSLFADNSKLDSLGEEIVDLIELYRKESIEKSDPKGFNHFMIDFVQTFRGTNIWYLLLAKEIKPIGESECQNSDVSQEMVENYTNLTEDQIKIETEDN